MKPSANLGGLDCLVNNAGIAGPTGRVDEIDPAEWEQCLEHLPSPASSTSPASPCPHLKASDNILDHQLFFIRRQIRLPAALALTRPPNGA